MNQLKQESFLNWLMDIPDKETEKWENWIKSSKENQQFAKKAKLYLSAMRNNKKTLENSQVEDLWKNIEDSINMKQLKTQRIPIRKIKPPQIYKIAAAASIILFITVGSIVYLNQVKLNGIAGETISYTLPDSSIVTINAAGKIAYNKILWKFSRQVSLNGEAFFKVTKGEQFTVNCPTASVSVLGTSFNIKAHDNYFRTECYTGRVRVKIPYEKYEQVITKNEAITAGQNQNITFSKFKGEHISPGWLNGEYNFSNAPFPLVLQEIENQFKVKFINIPTDNSILFTGYFNIENLNQALEFVLLPMGYTYSFNDNKIELEKTESNN